MPHALVKSIASTFLAVNAIQESILTLLIIHVLKQSYNSLGVELPRCLNTSPRRYDNYPLIGGWYNIWRLSTDSCITRCWPREVFPRSMQLTACMTDLTKLNSYRSVISENFANHVLWNLNFIKILFHLGPAWTTTESRAASRPKEGFDPCQQLYLHVKLKPGVAHDLILIEYIRRENVIVKKAVLVTSFKILKQFNLNFLCIGAKTIGNGGRKRFCIFRVEACRW